MNVVLVSTYDLGHQPFGLASPAAWLREAGHAVRCVDLAVGTLPAAAIEAAYLVAFHLPMHTATRLAAAVIGRVREINPGAHLCCYGLYAPINEAWLRGLGVATILGGEFESGLLSLAGRLTAGDLGPQREALVSLDRLQFRTPDRSDLPTLSRYSRLNWNGASKSVGYTEASRGCKHRCRHCPVVPVYDGAFRVVQAGVVLEDIRRQVSAGAGHITFGDPDFFNGPAHALKLVEALHGEFPALTYDVTIKIEHLLENRPALASLRDTGCLFVTSAVESVDDAVLEKLEKGHTRRDFIEVAGQFRALGLTLAPTFIPFTPWTTWDGYRDMLQLLAELGLVENVSPVQLALRLLITQGSRLLELDDIRAVIEPFDSHALLYRWRHADPSIDALGASLLALVAEEQSSKSSRTRIFARIWEETHGRPPGGNFDLEPRTPIPYMDEPWYCCAEPTPEQLAQI